MWATSSSAGDTCLPGRSRRCDRLRGTASSWPIEATTRELRTYANQGLLLDTNVPGQELFGAVSTEVQGIDLNPVLTSDTRLADLRDGQGITTGTLLVSDGVHTSTVSIAGAETIGDVARLIEANPPAGREVRVTVEARGCASRSTRRAEGASRSATNRGA